jgi:hypothetical protein
MKIINICQRGMRKKEKLANVKNALKSRPKYDKKSETATKSGNKIDKRATRSDTKNGEKATERETKNDYKATRNGSKQRPNPRRLTRKVLYYGPLAREFTMIRLC